jgi:MFS family permease
MPIADQIVLELDGTRSKSASIMLITIWELGEAAGPLLIAPLSEIYGRYPVFNVANIGFILGIALAALSQNTGLLIFARFLTGLSVASNVLNPSVIGDIFPTESRGTGMALVMFSPLVGGAIGPAVSGIFAEHLGWRNFLWMCALVAVICEILFFTLLRETYKIAILERRAARLREETQDKSVKCAWEAEDAKKTSWSTLRVSISRPFALLVDSSVLRIMSIYGGLTFTFFYILATTLPGILRDIYGFSPALIGTSYLCFSKLEIQH